MAYLIGRAVQWHVDGANTPSGHWVTLFWSFWYLEEGKWLRPGPSHPTGGKTRKLLATLQRGFLLRFATQAAQGSNQGDFLRRNPNHPLLQRLSQGACCPISAESEMPAKDPQWLQSGTLVTRPWLLRWHSSPTTPGWWCCSTWLMSYCYLKLLRPNPCCSKITKNPLLFSQVEECPAICISNESSRHCPAERSLATM